MSGILARLVERARGDAVHRLRPRLPARFEALMGEGGAGEAGFEPVVSATPFPEAPQAATPDAPPARIAPRSAEPAEPASAAMRLEPPQDSPRIRPETDLGASPTQPPRAAVAPGAGSGALTPPLARPAPRDTAEQSQVPGRQPPSVLQRVEGAPRRNRLSLEAPPGPLMPVAQSPSLVPAVAAPPTAPLSHRRGPESRRAPAAPHNVPDIVINIGRIDLKSAPAPVPRVRPKRDRKPMTSLSDYLNGRGGGR
jgi:hypothetical protein